jgi:6-phosphogluconate dehydrogenase
MQIGMVGLGRMGLNMSSRLIGGGHKVVGFDLAADKRRELESGGGSSAASLEELVSKLERPRNVWIMLPAGEPVEDALRKLKALLTRDDTVIDGGNSYYKDDIRRAQELAAAGIRYLDAGVSGGIWGLKIGYCLMVGGAEADFKRLEPIFKTLAPPDGYMRSGGPGAGHFVKMVHNGIEYGLMQAYAEGFQIIDASPYKQDMGRLSHLWNQGSVIRSWLLELAEQAFVEDPGLDDVKGFVEDSGEGRWTVQQAVDGGVPAPVITLSLFARFQSRQPDSFSNKVLASLRNKFGGHKVLKKA